MTSLINIHGLLRTKIIQCFITVLYLNSRTTMTSQQHLTGRQSSNTYLDNLTQSEFFDENINTYMFDSHKPNILSQNEFWDLIERAKKESDLKNLLQQHCHFDSYGRFRNSDVDQVFWYMIDKSILTYDELIYDPVAKRKIQRTFALYPRISAYNDNGVISQVFNESIKVFEIKPVNLRCTVKGQFFINIYLQKAAKRSTSVL